MKKWLMLLIVFAIAGLGAFWILTQPQRVVAADDSSLEKSGDATRGRAVFFAGGCASCHATPGQKNALHLGGGLGLHSPFGTFYAPNISSDPNAGIGKWKVADLINALKAGVAPDGSHYYPSFPYTTYAKMTNSDVANLMAFLRTVPAVKTPSKEHGLAFPFTIRRGLGLWKMLYLKASPITPDKSKSEEWNRGRYLVEALGHCAECHSARNFMGGIIEKYRYAGGPDPEGKGWIPNMTQSKEGIADWSVEDIRTMLKTGLTPEIDSVGSTMADVVKNMAELSDVDLKAMAAYIKTIPPAPSPPRPEK